MATTLAYIKRQSPLHRLNPLTPLTFALCVTALGIAVNSPPILFAVFLVTVAFIVLAKVFRPFIKMFLLISLPIAIPMLFIHGFFSPGAEQVIWRWGPLALKREGLVFATSVISRLFSMIAAYFLLVMVVPPRDLVIALEKRSVSPKIGYLVLSSLQLIPYIQRTAETILDAQRSRGLRTKGSLTQRIKAYIPLLAPVVMGSISALEVRAMALEVRGFNLKTPRSYLAEIEDSSIDRILRWSMVVLTVGAVGGYYALRLL